MSAAQGLTRMGQKQAEALMESTCTITRTTGEPTVDHSTGAATPAPRVIYQGKCRLRFPFVRPQQALAEGQVLEKARGILSLPISEPTSANVRAMDIAEITVNPADPAVVNLTVRIESGFPETHPTARRLPIELIS